MISALKSYSIEGLTLFCFGAIAPITRRHSLANSSENRGHESLHRDQDFAVPGNDRLALAAGDSAQHLVHGLFGIHHQPRRYRIFGFAMELALVVHAPDIALHKAGA